MHRRAKGTPHAALRSLHAAERALVLAAHKAAVADKRASILADFAALLSAAEQRIIAYVAGRIAAIDPGLSLSARMAETERLKAEQEAALMRLRQDIAGERRQTLRSALTTLSSGYRRARIALARRQQAERAGMRRAGPPQNIITEAVGRPGWTAVRRFVTRVLPLHANARYRLKIKP